MNLHPEQPQTCDCQTFFWARKNHSERKFLPITALSALNNTSQTHLYIRLSKWIVLLFLSVHWAQHRRLLADCWWFGLLCLDAPFTFSWYILIQSFFSHTDAVADVWEVYFSKKVDLRLKLPSNILYCCGWNAPSSVPFCVICDYSPCDFVFMPFNGSLERTWHLWAFSTGRIHVMFLKPDDF